MGLLDADDGNVKQEGCKSKEKEWNSLSHYICVCNQYICLLSVNGSLRRLKVNYNHDAVKHNRISWYWAQHKHTMHTHKESHSSELTASSAQKITQPFIDS